MVKIFTWDHKLFAAQSQPDFQVDSFGLTSGYTLSGVEHITQTSKGAWRATLAGIVLNGRNIAQRKAWQGLRQALASRVNLVAVGVSNYNTIAAFNSHGAMRTGGFDDGARFSDGAGILTAPFGAELAESAGIGDSVVKIRFPGGAVLDPVGLRFEFMLALYEIGPVLSTSGDVFEVPISPSIRRNIPAGAALEIIRPKALMRLASPREMAAPIPLEQVTNATVNFVEAVDYWEALADGRAA